MTVYRRKFKCKTAGSRAEANLHPVLSNVIPNGINTVVHSYDEPNGTCIVEAWCSDHEILPAQHRKTEADLQALDGLPCILEVLENDPKNPGVLGTISISEEAAKIGLPNPGLITAVDRKNKQITFLGKQHTYVRTDRFKDTKGAEHEQFVLDEG